MYRIVKHKTYADYFTGHIPREDWLNSIEATYVGERVDLASIKDVWIPVIGGSYHYVKETLEAWSHSE